jgi:hypothetical protein
MFPNTPLILFDHGVAVYTIVIVFRSLTLPALIDLIHDGQQRAKNSVASTLQNKATSVVLRGCQDGRDKYCSGL